MKILRLFSAVREKRAAAARAVIWLIEIALVILFAWLAVMLFGRTVGNAGDSMKPALKNGDIVLIDRVIYTVGSPKRGDIVAFRSPGGSPSRYIIKRIAALPGETVQIRDGKLFIDGREADRHIFAKDIAFAGTAQDPQRIGEDEYFVLGDNPSGSDDSREPRIGRIKRGDIYGRVWIVVSPREHFGFLKR